MIGHVIIQLLARLQHYSPNLFGPKFVYVGHIISLSSYIGSVHSNITELFLCKRQRVILCEILVIVEHDGYTFRPAVRNGSPLEV